MAMLESEIGDLLREKGLTLGVVESATGGLIAKRITSVPGSSDYFRGGVTAYSNEVKTAVVGVAAATIEVHGAVSEETAEEMAEGGRKLLGVDICISDTGIAGPGGGSPPEKPVGLFYVGLADKNGVTSWHYYYHATREGNRRRAGESALRLLKERLLEYET